MRTKKPIKNTGEIIYAATRWQASSPGFKIKFDTSIQNISCFIGDKETSVKPIRKKSRTQYQARKSASKGKGYATSR